MTEQRIHHMANEIIEGRRADLIKDAEALMNDLKSDVCSRYVYIRLRDMLSRAEVLNAWNGVSQATAQRSLTHG